MPERPTAPAACAALAQWASSDPSEFAFLEDGEQLRREARPVLERIRRAATDPTCRERLDGALSLDGVLTGLAGRDGQTPRAAIVAVLSARAVVRRHQHLPFDARLAALLAAA